MMAFEDQHPWEGAIRHHPVRVYLERFCPTLNRQFFVYCDHKIDANGLVTWLRWTGTERSRVSHWKSSGGGPTSR
jgi:hypothetical protein